MRVKLRLHGIVGDLLRPNADVLEMPEGSTLADLIEMIAQQNEQNAAILRQAHVFLDGHLVEGSSPVVEGAVVTIMRPMSGG